MCIRDSTYLVFTAVAFSLLGLRQLFFLIEGLLDRLIFLSYGLAAILGFIGVKLILHALHENEFGFINDGEPVPVVEVSTGLSLGVILGVLTVTVVASLLSPAGKAHTAISAARRHATSYLDAEYTKDPAERERIFQLLLAERDQIVALRLAPRSPWRCPARRRRRRWRARGRPPCSASSRGSPAPRAPRPGAAPGAPRRQRRARALRLRGGRRRAGPAGRATPAAREAIPIGRGDGPARSARPEAGARRAARRRRDRRRDRRARRGGAGGAPRRAPRPDLSLIHI